MHVNGVVIANPNFKDGTNATFAISGTNIYVLIPNGAFLNSTNTFTSTNIFTGGFQIPNGAVNGYVLVSDGKGVGTWQALVAPGSSNSFSVNGTILTPANIQDTTNVLWFLSGSNVVSTLTNIANMQIANGAAIDWTKINKAGSTIADLSTRSAGDLNSGILPDGRYRAADNTTAIMLGTPTGLHGNNSITLGDNNSSGAQGALNISAIPGSVINGTNGISLNGIEANGLGAIAIQGGIADGGYSFAIFPGATAAFSDSVAFGRNAITTRTNQFRLGASGSQVVIPGDVQVTNNTATYNLTVSNAATLNGSNTFNGPVRFTTEPLNSSLIFDCVVKELSGYVSNGMTALTVTGGSLSAADVGKTIQVWQPDRVFTDGYITNGTAVLYSTNAVFTAVDLGKTIEISDAGVGGVSLVATISTINATNQITISTNAPTTISSNTCRIISVPLVTTITAVGGATSATLNASPSVTHTNAHVVYGTENRVSLSNSCSVVQAAHTSLRVGPGKAMVLLTTASPWGNALSTNDLNLIGAGKKTTELIIIKDAIPSVDGGLFHIDKFANLSVKDLTIRYYGPISASIDGTTGGGNPTAFEIIGGGSGSTRNFYINNVDSFNLARTSEITSSSDINTQTMYMASCQWISQVIGTSFFCNNGATRGTYLRIIRDCYIETTRTMNSFSSTANGACEVVYDHPAVDEDWLDVHTQTESPSWHFHHYASSSQGKPTLKFKNVLTTGSGDAFLLTANGGKAEFDNPTFLNAGNGIYSAGDVNIWGGYTSNYGPTYVVYPYVNGPGGNKFKIYGHTMINTNAFASLYDTGQAGQGGGSIEAIVSGCTVTGRIGGSTSSSNNLVHIGNKIITVATDYPIFTSDFAASSNCVIKFIGNLITGNAPEIIRYGTATNVSLEVSHNRNDSQGALVRDRTTTGNGSMAFGRDNEYVSFGEPQSDGRMGSQFVARSMLNPTTIASASEIDPSFNYGTHQVTGSTTIDTIYVGGTLARNRVAYEVTLITAAGATWSTSTAGNIVPLTTAARTAGQAYTFRWDSIDQKWREIGGAGGGTPGGSVGQLQFNNTVFGGIPGVLYSNPTLILSNVTAGAKILTFDDTPTGNTNSDATWSVQLAPSSWQFWGYNSDKTVSNLAYRLDGIPQTTMTIGGPFAALQGGVVTSNLLVTGNLTAQGGLSGNGVTSSGTAPGGMQLSYPTADAFNFGIARSASAMATNVQFTAPLSPPSVPSFAVYTPDGSGTNSQMSFLPTNAVTGSGSSSSLTNPTIYGPIRLPQSAGSTNIDWATNAGFAQGYTATGDFTNVFQNAPPPSEDWHIQYTVNNGQTTNVGCWLGPVGTANAITNNYWVNFSTPTNVVLCPPGTTRFEWGWNGSKYYFRTTMPGTDLAITNVTSSLFTVTRTGNGLGQTNAAIGATSDTPQFARLGLGAAADSTAKLSVNGVLLTDDAANTLAFRNGTSGQTLNIYRTYTDASNYERASIGWQGSTTFTISTEKLGTGVARDLQLGTAGSSAILFFINNGGAWEIDSAKRFLSQTDNANDIGQTGSGRPRDIYVAGGIIEQNLRAYLASDATTASATLANLTLSTTLVAAKKYSFTLILFLSDSVAADGAVVDFNGGSATMTDFRAQFTSFDTALNLSTQTTTLAGTASMSTFTGSGMVEVHGAMTVNAAGTFIPRFAQAAHTTGTLTCFKGSNIIISSIN